jgi:hypothetical protein
MQELDHAIDDLIASETGSLVESGRATLERGSDGSWKVKPRNPGAAGVTVYLQSDREVSLWPITGEMIRAPTVDIWSRDPAGLLSELCEYLGAIFAGRIELTLRPDSAGRCRFWLSDGRCQTHLYNFFFEFRIGRGPNWKRFRPEPY